jgi:hypothetical protein
MAGANLLYTSTLNFGALLGNGRVYRVPNFQRDYSWKEDEWEDLWNDLLGLDEEQAHYRGYIVLQSDDMQNFTIIDGQQRLTTLSILALAVLKHLQDLIDKGIEPDENKERLEILRNDFLGHKDPSSLIPTSKLFLNRNNDDFYQSFLLRLRKPSNVQKLKPSEKLLWKSFVYFYDSVKEHFGNGVSGQALAKFLNETVSKRLVFTVIQVSDDLSAYKVFETLNARGVKLSTTDLLKNYLFSVVARTSATELTEAERQWQGINNTLGAEDFTTFLRHYWNSRQPFERKSNLFKAIKKSVGSSQDVFDLLDALERFAPVYMAFSRPADAIWQGDRERRKSIAELDLFNVSQCYSLLLSGYERLEPQEFTRLLQICAIISFRYNVIGNLNANTMEEVYNRAALKVYKGEATSARQIFQELKPIYVADESFKNDFSTKAVNTGSGRGKKLARYILFSIENQLANKDYDFEDGTATIEHILPENPGEQWEQFFSPEEQESAVYRLGNLTLLEVSKNKECGNATYGEKLKIYQTSAYRLTAQETNFSEWTPETLRKRQERMARWANAVWRMDF